MKIGMILDHEFPPDIRVENEAVILAENGFDVNILCFAHDKSVKSAESFNGVNIQRLFKNRNLVKKGRALINTPFDYYTSYWAKKIKKFIQINDIDILHVHDLYMLGAAFKANKSAGLKIVADLHENYVDGLSNYQFANTFPGNLVISKSKWAKTEIEWCQKVDYLITVIDEAVDRYTALGVSKHKIHVVVNYVNLKTFLNEEDDLALISGFKDQFTATYIGGFDFHRGLESVIKAVPGIVREIPNFLLVLVGSGKNLDQLKNLAQDLNILKHISFEGFQQPKKLPSYIKASSLCLIPHLKTVHTDNTIPHKLFHYMLVKKPVIATNCNPIERIINETQSGMIYSSNQAADLAEKIIKMYKNPTVMKEMGKNGHQAVLATYNWDKTAENLLELYKQVEQNLIQD